MPYIPIAIGAVVALLVIFIVATGYVKAPPDTAYIISGFKKEPRVLIGRAGIRIPFLERKDFLIIKQISVDIKTNGYVPTYDYIGVDVDAVAKIRVKTDVDGISLAMKNFLNNKEDKIIAALTDSLQGNMREIIGTVKLKELCNDRKKFGDEVQEKAQKDMNALGIEIISCNIQKIEDEKGLIIALGQDNMSQIQKDASIAKAQADRDVAIAEAEAKKAANDAQVKADLDIAERRNDLEIRQAELKRQADIKRAEADASYRITEQEQRKTIETAAMMADIARTEKQADLEQRGVLVERQKLEASIRAKADADLYAQQKEAEADLYKRQKEAEARRYEQEQEAEAAKRVAEAKKFAKTQEAEGIAAVGKAEAAAIEAKALAEAEGIDKRAEAMKKYGEAAIVEMITKAMPEIAKALAEPMSKIDHITMYGSGNTTGLVEEMTKNLSQISAGTMESMGINLPALVSGLIGGKLATGNQPLPPAPPAPPAEIKVDATVKTPPAAPKAEDPAPRKGNVW